MIAGTVQPRLSVEPGRRDDQDVAFPGSVGPAHPRIDRQLRVIFDVNDSVRGGEWVDDHQVAVTLENLEREIMVRYARNSQHVALRFGVRSRPLGAVFVALFERFGQVRNRTSAHNALPRRSRPDRAELPEVFESFGRMTL